MANLIKAYNSTIKLNSGAVVVADDASLSSLFSAAENVTAKMKNVTVSPPEGAVDKVDFLGVEAGVGVTTNKFQNALLDEKPYGMAVLTGTLIVDRDDYLEQFMDAGSTAVTSGGDTWDRYQFGVLSATSIGRPVIAAMVDLVHPYTGTASKQCTVVLNNALMTKDGDYRISGADGHWEVDISITCLAKDFYIEYMQ